MTDEKAAREYAEQTPVKDILAMANDEGPTHLKQSRYYAHLAGQSVGYMRALGEVRDWLLLATQKNDAVLYRQGDIMRHLNQLKSKCEGGE